MPIIGEHDEIMTNHLQSQEFEKKPVSELTELQSKKLVENDVICRAAISSLYQDRWQQARIKPKKINRIEYLKQLPFIREEDLLSIGQGKRGNLSTCSPVQAWFKADGKNNISYWMPYAKDDIENSWEFCRRFSRITSVTKQDKILVISRPAPSLSDALPYFLAYAYKLNGNPKAEIIPVCLALLEQKREWVNFFRRRGISILIAMPDDALRVAEILSKRINREADSAPHTPLFVGQQIDDAVNRSVHCGQKPLLDSLRLIILYGPDVNFHWQRVAELYGVDTIQTYGITNLGLFNSECKQGSGIHIWLDVCIPEIIPVDEIDMERTEINYTPHTEFLSGAPDGFTGELVITTFGQALPLVRYRTNQQIKVVAKDPCQCGCTHPRVKLL